MSWQRPQSEFRASDAERERVVAFLREHALAGRLSHEELEDRVGAAYAAVTIGDLERLIDDLPRAGHPAPAQPRPAAARRRRHNDAPPALVVAGIALLMVTGLPVLVVGGVIAALAVVFAVSFALGPFLLVALIIVLATRRHRRPPPPPMRWGRVY